MKNDVLLYSHQLSLSNLGSDRLSRDLRRIGVGWALKFRHARWLSHHPKDVRRHLNGLKKWTYILD
jgi:hypothetical protein